jgi:hypothetical protein
MQRSVVLGVMALAATMAGCTNKKDKPAIDALEGLRGAITSNGDTTRFGDSKVLAEAAIFSRSEGLSAGMLVLSQGALDVMLGDIVARTEPRTYWARARVYLRPGTCAKIEEVPLPAEARTSQPDSGWQATVRAKHTSVTTRLTNAFAADFRCGDGPRFTAVFTRAEPVDGTIRVANITASQRGR